MLEYLCDNIGPVLVCLPSRSIDVTTSPSRYMTQPSGIPILSPVLFMHVGDPYIPLFKIRRIFDLLVIHYDHMYVHYHTCFYVEHVLYIHIHVCKYYYDKGGSTGSYTESL